MEGTGARAGICGAGSADIGKGIWGGGGGGAMGAGACELCEFMNVL